VQILRRGSEGDEVRRWQTFLLGQELLRGPVDGIFGPGTEAGTRGFQRRARLEVDGTVGPLTLAAALRRGFDPGFRDPQGGTSGADWPPRPIFAPLVANAEREARFGRFAYERIAPDKDDIRILDDWQSRNIRRVALPQLRGKKGAPASARIAMHRLVVDQTRALFDAWEAAGLMPLVLSWQGSFAPRFVRGNTVTLSNHAWGTAFDVNYEWNKLGALPALRGRKGSLRELVPLANEHGFYWGGHFVNRADGMHFEVARVLG
jgi:D-alanyl-D-alanine carboxypeptidase/Putative peptidoglycan binding domain